MQHWDFWMVACDVCVRATVVGTDRNGNDVPEHCPLCGSMKVMVTDPLDDAEEDA